MLPVHELLNFFISTPKAAWIVFSFITMTMFIGAIVMAHFGKENNFSVVDLTFFDNGKMSASTARLNGAFLIMAWSFIWLVLSDKLTEWYSAIFVGAWVLDKMNSRIIGSKAPNPVVE